MLCSKSLFEGYSWNTSVKKRKCIISSKAAISDIAFFQRIIILVSIDLFGMFVLIEGQSLLQFLDFYRPQRSWGKVTFLHVSVILSHCMLGYTPPTRGRHPSIRHPLWDQAPLGTRPPRTRHLPGSRPPSPGTPRPVPQHSACREIRATSGRYASYWNAIFWLNLF